MLLSTRLRKLAQPYIHEQLQKPFLRGIRDGNLSLDKFQYYIKIDFPYLLNYNKVLALGVFKSDNLEVMKVMARLLEENIRETSLHESFAAKYGLTLHDLEKQKMGPIKNAYAQHELTVALNGSLVELLVALLPCMWGYAEIAEALIKQRPIENENPYKEWLLYYTTDEYKQLGIECMNLIDKLSRKCNKAQIERLEEYFQMSSYYEVMCWDAYYAKEDWQI